MTVPTRMLADAIDLKPRVIRSGTVAASPSAAAETTICTLTVDRDLQVSLGIFLVGFAAYTVGTSGTAVNMRIRQTDTSGTVVKATGATTRSAGNLVSQSVLGFDTAPVLPNQTYVLTMTVTAGAAASTVSAAELVAIVI